MVQFSRKPLCPQGVCDAFRAYVRQPGGARVHIGDQKSFRFRPGVA